MDAAASANRKIFRFMFDEHEVTFSSDFESGNLSLVEQQDSLTYNIYGQPDNDKAIKSCLYFSVTGFPIGARIKIRLKGMAILYLFYLAETSKEKKPDTSYQLCLRRGDDEWQRMLQGTSLEMNEDKQLTLSFAHTFWTNQKTEFAFNYPYTYERHEQFYNKMRAEFQKDAGDILYDDQPLAMSRQGRPIRLITISNRNAPIYTKPVILVTARVHPSESPSSFAAEGVINFMTNRKDLRSHRLRENFVVMVIPMLNPDGVAMGNFRYDDIGQNLNRYYIEPDPNEQPTIFAVKTVIEQISSRVIFYFDLHAHHSPKGCFIYGNFLEEFVRHVEAKVFCKVMSVNNCDFEYANCNFSQNQMTAKDRQEAKTKEGCGRVVVHKLSNLLHSYTVQCGYYRGSQPNEPTRQSNTAYTQQDFCYTPSENTECERIYKAHNYRQIGRDLMISVSDVLGINPYSRIAKSQFRDMQAVRRIVSSEVFYSDQRFRRTDTGVLQKLKNINQLIGQLYQSWQFDSPLKRIELLEDKRRELERPARTQTHMRYHKQVIIARRNIKVSDMEEPEDEPDPKNNTLVSLEPKQQYSSQSKSQDKRVMSINYGGRRTMRITSTILTNKKQITPIKPSAIYAKSELKLNVNSQKSSSQLRATKNIFKMSSRKITKTQASVNEFEKKIERLSTEQQTLVTNQEKSLNMEFKVCGPESYRREIIVGSRRRRNVGENSLIKCYENARKRVAAISRPDDRIIFKLPKLQSLVEVKARIIQQCRLENVLKSVGRR